MDQPLRLNSIVDWALKSMLPDQNTVLEESVFHSMGQVRHSVCGGSERHSFLTLHDVLFPGFSEVKVPDLLRAQCYLDRRGTGGPAPEWVPPAAHPTLVRDILIYSW